MQDQAIENYKTMLSRLSQKEFIEEAKQKLRMLDFYRSLINKKIEQIKMIDEEIKTRG